MRVSTVVAVLALVLIAVLVLYGASLSSGGGEDDFESGSSRLLLVSGAGAFLAFVLGYAVRDIMGKRSARASAAQRRAGR